MHSRTNMFIHTNTNFNNVYWKTRTPELYCRQSCQQRPWGSEFCDWVRVRVPFPILTHPCICSIKLWPASMFWQLCNLIDMFWQCSQPASTIITHRFLLSSLLGRFADDDSDDVVIMDRCWHWWPSWGRKSKASPHQGHHHHHHEWSIQVKVSETPSPTCFRLLVHISSAPNTTRNVFAYKPGPPNPLPNTYPNIPWPSVQYLRPRPNPSPHRPTLC